ncbi:MAG: M20/M25/M40 family metallo-hydrolase, partial [Cyclobacteriaceae bacterium]|nr:M20/M25/M40 family metallo-hydrolase [Cyclobacteriaceae bacterium]
MKNTTNIQLSANQLDNYYEQALTLLQELIKTPSFSKEEDQTAAIIRTFLENHQVVTRQKGNNIWATNLQADPAKPTILLNSHHDTVKPNQGYTHDPFTPITRDGKLYGLGSNDAGGALVSLLLTFLHFYRRQNLPYNLVMAATAEEENSGKGGVESIL